MTNRPDVNSLAKTADILIDSNILIYAINSASPKHQAAQAFLQQRAGNLVIAHQNILEVLRVLTHSKFPSPMSTAHATRSIEGITQACRIIVPDRTTSYIALDIIQQAKLTSNQIFDAYLAATALSAGVAAIATDNTKDFAKLQLDIQLLNPFITKA